MKFEYDFQTILKFYSWAENLDDDVDFIDYWFNLFLSKTKAEIEHSFAARINAFHWTRWQEDFEEFVDKYQFKPGNGFEPDKRQWFAQYMQYLVYAFQLSSRDIALFYKKEGFLKIMEGWFRYHTFGADLFVETVVRKYGKPTAVNQVLQLNI